MKKASALSSTLSIAWFVTLGCNECITPGSANKLISNSSGFETAFIALLNATEPEAVAELKSNPCVLVAEMFVPDFLSIAGFWPS